MAAFMMHLILSAYVAPLIACLLLFLIGPVFPLHEPMPTVPIVQALCLAFIAPGLSWYVFVPLACCSSLFFRVTATGRARGLFFWMVAWCLFGAAAAEVFALAIDVRTNLLPLIVTGSVVGILIAPLHRILWRQLYEDSQPNTRNL